MATYNHSVYKKCLCCGKTYPVSTKKVYCTCEKKGFLYVMQVSYLPVSKKQ